MNKYFVAVCDCQQFNMLYYSFMARSFEDAEDKLMSKVHNLCKKIPDDLSYTDFLKECDKNDICIGEISYIDEL